MDDAVFMALMRALPRSALSNLVGQLVRAPAPARVHQLVMRVFARAYDVDLSTAESELSNYPTFAQFFSRRLKPGLRPVDADPKSIVSPVDGTVSETGTVQAGRCVQAKGIDFPVGKLLGDEERAKRFEGGAFATLYLAPRDYHRIHAPVGGTITGSTYLPGEFWPVNPISVRSVDALFAVNERLVTWIDSPAGQVAVVAVGATCVSRIHASYDSITTHTGQPRETKQYPAPIPVEKGGELGMFEMGSTVILVFETGKATWEPWLTAGARLLMGQRIGRLS
jgi:phosphatidylserine decarboxylase